jgi:hypothetical protein
MIPLGSVEPSVIMLTHNFFHTFCAIYLKGPNTKKPRAIFGFRQPIVAFLSLEKEHKQLLIGKVMPAI